MGYVEDERWRNALSGGVSGAGTGAGIGGTIGSIVPGVGTAIGAGIGAGIGAIGGSVLGYFLTDDEKNEVIEAARAGKIDEQTLKNIETTVKRRFDMINRRQTALQSRAGITNSTFGARQIRDTANADRQTLVDALAAESGRLKEWGFGMSDQAGARRAQDVSQGVGSAFNAFQIHQEGKLASADAKRDDMLFEALGKLYKDDSANKAAPTLWNNAPRPSVVSSQGGAGGVFSRQRTRQPNTKSPFLPQNQTLDQVFGRV